ncbi:MAG: excinuclease ABC subunit UvrA, partial [Bacteroidetes bacterium SW_10_40_5]
MRINGEIQEIEPGIKLSRYKIHDIELLVDRVKVKEGDTTRLRNSVQTALKQGNGTLMLLDQDNNEKARHFSRNLMCPDTGISYDEPQPNTFSFNSPYGYCPECKGTGQQYEFDENDILPDKSKSIAKGAIEPMGSELGFYYKSLIKALGNKYNFKLATPINKFSREAIDCLLYGSNERLQVDSFFGNDHFTFEGIVNIYRRILSSATYKSTLKKALEEMVSKA